MKHQPTRGEIVTMAGGAVTVLSSFLAFYSLNSAIGDFSVNAWDSGLFPLATYPAFAGLLSGGVIALRRFAHVGFSGRVGTFTWEQMHLLLGAFAGLIMGGYLIADTSASYGIGFWGMLGGTAALIVGAVIMPNERHGPRGLA